MRKLAWALLVLTAPGVVFGQNQLTNGDFEAAALVGAGQTDVSSGGSKMIVPTVGHPAYAANVSGIVGWQSGLNGDGMSDSGPSLQTSYSGSRSVFINNWDRRFSQTTSVIVQPGVTYWATVRVRSYPWESPVPARAARFTLLAGTMDASNRDLFAAGSVVVGEVTAATFTWTQFVADVEMSMTDWRLLVISYTAPASGPAIGKPLTVAMRTESSSAGPTYWDDAWLTVGSPPPSLPVNDRCGGAISFTGSVFVDSTNATTGPERTDAQLCDTSVTFSRDLWYRWTAPATGTAVIGCADGSGMLDYRMAIYSGGGCLGARLACNDNSGEPGADRARIFLPVVAGQVYTVQIGVTGSGFGTDYTVLYAHMCVASDTPAGASLIAIDPILGYQGIDAGNATTDSNPLPAMTGCSGGGIERDVWCRVPCGQYGLIVNTSRATPIRVAAYSVLSDGSPGLRIQCRDLVGGTTPQSLVIYLRPGVEVWLRIGSVPGSTPLVSVDELRLSGQVGPNERRCTIDIASLGGDTVADQLLSIDDLVAYLGAFFRSDLTMADFVHVGGSGGPDNQVTVDDLVVYLNRFFQGCPADPPPFP